MATPRKPQDHKPSDAEVRDNAAASLEDLPPLDETPGHELLRPLDEIDGIEQTELLMIFESNEDQTGAVLALARKLRDEYVVDAEAFAKFNRGPGAAGRLINLTMAYVGEMGKGVI